ncbi:type IV secretory system conjugative DNA transfer family protein [Variovorax sp. KK3]|uniref:type IV secretory system conjugative DNA transfer family protein n=1 Tax=Variovorax sp. KK3 TaxID=1855728 RepID=UPI00097C98E6|nr:type IV secretory system conjugative DNA transfer family protein [Variovorax sp. KK3]
MTGRHKAAIAAGALVAVVCFLTLANYLAGVILFLSYRQSPEHAAFTTIEQAWEVADTPAARQKVKASAALSLVLCLVLPGLLLQALLAGRKPPLHGNARFANARDIAKEGLDGPHGIILGKHDGQLLRLPGYEFVLLAAPTRTGKGVGFCIPNLLTFPDSAVVLDIKGENFNLTGQFRAQYLGNQVFYFNPFSASTCRWNPLSYVSKDPNFRVNDLMALAAIIYQQNPKDPFWPDSARNLFVGLALLVLETPQLPHTIGEILRQGSGKGQQMADYLTHVMAVRASSGMPLSTPCVDALNRFLNNPDNTLKNILSSFVAPLALWGNAIVDKATSADDFDLREVRRRKMTIYIHIPANEVVQAGFILNMFFSQLINENVRELPEDNPDLKHQCLLLMDEFTAMGKVAILAKGVGYMAGYNLRLAIVIQDRSQLEAVYGREDAHNIVSNMGAMIVFTPSQVKEAEEYSKLIGNQTVKSSSMQRSNIGAFSAGRSSLSESESSQARAVMLPQEILGMDRKLELIVRAGIPVIQAEKIQYYADPFFSERFAAVPMRDVVINGQQRKVPKVRPLPRTNWRVYRQAVDRSDYYLQDDFSDLSPAFASMGEASILDAINAESQAMDAAQLDVLCQTLLSRKVEEYEQLFERRNAS